MGSCRVFLSPRLSPIPPPPNHNEIPKGGPQHLVHNENYTSKWQLSRTPKFVPRSSTLASSTLTVMAVSSTYWLMICWKLHWERVMSLIRPILIAFLAPTFNAFAKITNKLWAKGQPWVGHLYEDKNIFLTWISIYFESDASWNNNLIVLVKELGLIPNFSFTLNKPLNNSIKGFAKFYYKNKWVVAGPLAHRMDLCVRNMLSKMNMSGRDIIWSPSITSTNSGWRLLCKALATILYALLSKW